jgi:hypothetical protein
MPVVYYKKVLGVVKLGRSIGICLVKNQRREQGANANSFALLRGRIEEEKIGKTPQTRKLPSRSQIIGHGCSANTLLRRQEWKFQM